MGCFLKPIHPTDSQGPAPPQAEGGDVEAGVNNAAADPNIISNETRMLLAQKKRRECCFVMSIVVFFMLLGLACAAFS
jgi:hypothetical protein